MCAHLAAAGYDVTEAASFDEAERSMRAQVPDLLVTAVRLGAFNGLHLVLRRSFRETRGRSVVVDDVRDRITAEEARKLGAGYVVKPVLWHELLQAIQRGETATSSSTAGGSASRRRWRRTRLHEDVPVTVDSIRALLVDVGYGGFRVTVPDAGRTVPESFLLRVRGVPVPIRAIRIWESLEGDPEVRCCGASVDSSDPDNLAAWRTCAARWNPESNPGAGGAV